MDARKMLSNLLFENNPQRSYYMIETLIFNLIKKHVELQNKPFSLNYRFMKNDNSQSYVADGYASEGFDSFIGETIFELKTYRMNGAINSKLYINQIQRIIWSVPSVKNIILIITADINKDERINIKKRILSISENSALPQVYIWDYSDLSELFDKYPDYVVKLFENINELILDSKIVDSVRRSDSKDDWLHQREQYINNLKKQYNDDNIVLFVGSGISVGAGIPSWDGLVTDLLVSLISTKLADIDIHLSIDEKNVIIKNLKNANGNSPLLLARYIKKGLEDGFVPVLTECLYRSCSNKSDILKSLSVLCMPQRNAIGIKAVVTYNFDDLIESNFLDKGIKYKSIYRELDFPTKREIGIYHVHGFLPRDRKKYLDVSKSLLVFSEDGYHDLMLDPYNWSNLTQLNFLRENTCLFIGLSMTDPNLRRILDIAMRKQENIDLGKHYAIIKRDLISQTAISSPNVNVDNLERFDNANLKLEESFFRDLGLNIIWINDFNEIPSILNQIKD